MSEYHMQTTIGLTLVFGCPSLVTVALSGAVLTVENDARFSLCGESFLRYVLKCPSRLCAKETLSRHHAVDGYSFGQSQSESQVVGGWS